MVSVDEFRGMWLIGYSNNNSKNIKNSKEDDDLPSRSMMPNWWPTDLGRPEFNPVARATSPIQVNYMCRFLLLPLLIFKPRNLLLGKLKDYYSGVLGLPHSNVRDETPKRVQLTYDEVISTWGTSPAQPVLALGAAFWLYGFDKKQPYPLEEYFNYMDNEVYKRIVEGLRTKKWIREAARGLVERVRVLGGAGLVTQERGRRPRAIIGVHVRRGDYWNKCRKIKDEGLRRKCYPSNKDFGRVVRAEWGSARRHRAAVGSDNDERDDEKGNDKPLVYVATNEPSVRQELDAMYGTAFDLVYLEDILSAAATNSENIPALRWLQHRVLDPVEKALIDIEICSMVEFFIGGFYSSFSRTIFERRELAGRAFTTF